jgi:hypothetical protein
MPTSSSSSSSSTTAFVHDQHRRVLLKQYLEGVLGPVTEITSSLP